MSTKITLAHEIQTGAPGRELRLANINDGKKICYIKIMSIYKKRKH